MTLPAKIAAGTALAVVLALAFLGYQQPVMGLLLDGWQYLCG